MIRQAIAEPEQPELLPSRILRAAGAFADRLAVADGGAALSYAEFLAVSDRLMSGLRARNIGPGAVVGVGLDRSARRLAAILALWRLGAVPALLDPAWPALRLIEIVERAGCALILSEGGQAGFGAVPAWTPNGMSPAPDAEPRPPKVSVAASDLAYIVYTSGSTGRPKGVEITHGNLAGLVAWHNSAFAVSPHDRASHLAGLAFDAAIWEVWPYLSAGASVHVVPEAARRDAAHLRDWLVDTGTTVAFAPTLLAETLVRLDWPVSPLRFLLTGGDRLRTAPPAALPFELVNNYGPTECTVVACSGPVPAADERGPPSIGRPIAGAHVRILDGAGDPVAPGGVGEICIGGALVGRGYRGEPAATAAAFVRDRFVADPDARLYRTGDLGSWNADGTIDFRGRLDGQLSIHGQRIEPDEVAHHLLKHPQVRSAAVIGVERKGGPILAAYFESAEPEAPTAEALRGFLADRLPTGSVPSLFVRLEQLPVTANGKLDRAALPPPAAAASSSEPAPMAIRPTEKRLIGILRDVLGERTIGLDDNFFLLGGHSLLGTQVVLRASEAFGVELTLRHLFNAPTVRLLAIVIERLVEELVAALDEEELALRACG